MRDGWPVTGPNLPEPIRAIRSDLVEAPRSERVELLAGLLARGEVTETQAMDELALLDGP